MVECGICFTEYQEGDLELHRKLCMPNLLFRCTLCNEDYMNKEGLWRHMDRHELADDSKELHCREIKAKHKLLQCSLCQDQRVYFGIHYRQHMQDAHDSFSRQCSERGEHFQSAKLRNDHVHKHCNARDQMETSKSDDYEANQKSAASETEVISLKMEITVDEATLMPIDGCEGSTANSCTEPAIKVSTKVQNSTCEQDQNSIDTISYMLAENNNEQSNNLHSCNETDREFTDPVCTYCGNWFKNPVLVYRHERRCHKDVKCIRCGKTFQGLINLKRHVRTRHTDQNRLSHLPRYNILNYPCEICGRRFKLPHLLSQHKVRDHHTMGDGRNVQIDQIQKRAGQDNDVDMDITVEKTSPLSHDDQGQSTVIPTTSNDHVAVDVDSDQAKLTEKKHHCPHCLKQFCTKGCLKIHSPGGAAKKRSRKAVGHDPKSKHGVQHIDGTSSNGNFEGMEQNLKNDEKMDLEISTADCSKENSTSSLVENSEDASSESPYIKCPYCEKLFSRGIWLARHIELCHSPCSCGITFTSTRKKDYHMMTKHNGPLHKCPACGQIFDQTTRYWAHLSLCRSKMCDLCGRKFSKHLLVVNHKKTFHHDDETSITTHSDGGNENEVRQNQIEKITFTKDSNEQETNSSLVVITDCPICGENFDNQHLVSKHVELTHQKTICLACRKTFANAAEVMNHKLICPQHRTTKNEGSKFGGEKISLVQGLSVQTDSMNMSQSENTELKTEIHTEDTMLQEPQSINIGSKKAAHVNEIIVKEISLEKVIPSASSDTSESAVHYQVPNDRNECLVRHEVACSLCALTFETKPKLDYHMVVAHTEPQFKCSRCPKAFHFIDTQRRHEKMHMRM